MHGDAILQQGVDKFGGVGEIGLIRRKYITARIAFCGVAQDLIIKVSRDAAAAAARRISAGRISACRGSSASSPSPTRSRLERRDSLWSDRPGIFAAPLDGIHPHPPDVEQECFAVARRQIENRAIIRNL